MTVGELQAEVASLGFETRLNDEAIRRGFIPAVNRGIAELDALMPRTARVTFFHRPPADLLPAFSLCIPVRSERKTLWSGHFFISVSSSGSASSRAISSRSLPLLV